jgi:hypothetical protein
VKDARLEGSRSEQLRDWPAVDSFVPITEQKTVVWRHPKLQYSFNRRWSTSGKPWPSLKVIRTS